MQHAVSVSSRRPTQSKYLFIFSHKIYSQYIIIVNHNLGWHYIIYDTWQSGIIKLHIGYMLDQVTSCILTSHPSNSVSRTDNTINFVFKVEKIPLYIQNVTPQPTEVLLTISLKSHCPNLPWSAYNGSGPNDQLHLWKCNPNL